MSGLPDIPVVDIGSGGADRLVGLFPDRLALILDTARRCYTTPLLRLGDRLSRRWAERAGGVGREECEAVAAMARAPGVWMLNFSYEWGCTAAVVADPDGAPRLLRTMDWRMPCLGRTLLAARRRGAAGEWIGLTWPGYIGAIQGLAPGRFAAVINQPPDPHSGLGVAGDWISGKLAFWSTTATPPALLLRRVFDECADFAEARRWLAETPLCAPAFFTLVGTKPGEAVIIERAAREAYHHDWGTTTGGLAISNHWLASERRGRSRSYLTRERLTSIRDHLATRRPDAAPFSWLEAPILNATTRLALEAVPATGELRVQGFEAEGPVTGVLSLTA